MTIKDIAATDPKKALNHLSIKYAGKKREIQLMQGTLADVRLHLILNESFYNCIY